MSCRRPPPRGVVSPHPEAATGPAPSWPCRRDLPLMERERELGTPQPAWAAAREGRRQVMLVFGEPGAGKTRLVAELADDAALPAVRTRRGRNRPGPCCPDGVEVLVGRCTHAAAAPYQPFVEALRADVAATPDAQLGTRLGAQAGELVRLLPELAERTAQRPPPASTSPELDQHRLFDAVAGWLAAAAASRPLLLVLEELHGAIRPTLLLLLRHVVRSTADAALAVVATYRDTGEVRSAALTDTLAELATQPDVSPLALDGRPPVRWRVWSRPAWARLAMRAWHGNCTR